MAHNQINTNLTNLLFSFMNQPDPMLSMLEWLCNQMMEAEVTTQLNAEKSERTDDRSGYRCGYRPRKLNTRLGTVYLLVPKVRKGGYVPFSSMPTSAVKRPWSASSRKPMSMAYRPGRLSVWRRNWGSRGSPAPRSAR